ncbi:hypothetical protein HZC21_04650 [Candidatus Peregrinibacteria bacterium]|nr:hypothetical protein [Candidatus Peregrinibacteria bacterium]
MAQLLLTHSSQFHRAIRTHGVLPLSFRIGKFFLMFSMTALIGVMSFFYLVKFTEIHTKGYQLRKLEIEKNKLLTSQEVKRTDIANLRSLQAVRESAIVSTMIPAKNPVFIKQDSSFAGLPSFYQINH